MVFFKKKDSSETPERRKYRRVSFKQIIGVKLYEKKKMIQSVNEGTDSRNLSLSGLLFESRHRYPLHAQLRIDLDISTTPNVKMISFIGEIIRIEELVKDKKYEYGICFKKIPRKDEAAFEHFILEYAGEQNKKGFIDRKRSFLFHFFSFSGMSYSERERGWFKIPPVRKRKILE